MLFLLLFLCTLLNDAKGRSQTVMKLIPIFSDLRPKFGQKPSAAVAVAVGAKPSATAVGFGLRHTPDDLPLKVTTNQRLQL